MEQPIELNAARDLTNRECAKILAGVIGALCQLTDVETVREAVAWVHGTEVLWQFQAQLKQQLEQQTAPLLSDLSGKPAG